MIGHRAVLGLSLLSALLFCAFAAQSASATISTNTTAFTCVKAVNGDFEDPHCDKTTLGKGEYAHQTFSGTTPVTVNNTLVTGGTKEVEPAVLNSQVGLTKVEITCQMVSNDVKEEGGVPVSFVHNVETEGKHTVTGFATTNFTECVVNKPSKCTVNKGTIMSSATVVGAEKLGAEAKDMGVELKGTGGEEVFTEITFEGEECALKNKTFKIKGSVIGTSGPTTASSQTNVASGATVVFTPENEMEKLKLGVEPATFKTIVTQTGPDNPLSATTTT